MTPAVLICVLIIFLPPEIKCGDQKAFNENVNFQNYVTEIVKGLPMGARYISHEDYYPTPLDDDNFPAVSESIDEIILD
jgi:hypothetical protein